jgi:hypothetical protein
VAWWSRSPRFAWSRAKDLIHLYLDGSLVSMTTGLDAEIVAPPGQHELRAEFVAVDHGPFQPRVVRTVTFSVRE